MAIHVPTHVPTSFSSWDIWEDINQPGSWSKIFEMAGRPSQRTSYMSSTLVENGMGTELLRLYSDIVSHNDFDAKTAIQNLTEFKLGGAINIAVNQDRNIGLVWNYRPIVRWSKIDEYRDIWRKYAHIPSKELEPEKILNFLREVVPLLGQWSLEMPRGYGSVTKSAMQTAIDEAEEELLVQCTELSRIGMLGEDTAQNPALNDYCVAIMNVRGKPSKPRDLWEKIAARAEWIGRAEFDQAVRKGHIVDPFTLAAMEMLRIYAHAVYFHLAA